MGSDGSGQRKGIERLRQGPRPGAGMNLIDATPDSAERQGARHLWQESAADEPKTTWEIVVVNDRSGAGAHLQPGARRAAQRHREGFVGFVLGILT